MASRGEVVKRTTKKGEVRWLARVWASRKRSVSKTFRTKGEAVDWLNDKSSDLSKRGKLIVPSRELFGPFLLNWLKVWKGDLKDHTREEYRRVLVRYVVAPGEGTRRAGRSVPEAVQRLRIGEYALKDLTADLLQELYNAIRSEPGRGARAAQYLHALLKGALRHAVSQRLLAESPLDDVKRPKATRRRPVITLSAAQVQRFVAAIEDHPRKALWTLELRHGIRPGEALALTWGDVTLEGERRTLRISKTLKEKMGEVGRKIVAPKTEASVREVVLGDAAGRALAAQRLRAGARALDPAALIFVTRNGTPLGENNVRREFKKLTAALYAQDAHLPEGKRFPKSITLYELRHTFITLMGDKGAPIAAVSASVGHANPMTTLKYYQRAAQDAALRLAQMADDLETAPPTPKVQHTTG